MCRKEAYATRKEARGQATFYHRRYGVRLRPYFCVACGLWCLTSMSRKASRRAAKRARRRAGGG